MFLSCGVECCSRAKPALEEGEWLKLCLLEGSFYNKRASHEKPCVEEKEKNSATKISTGMYIFLSKRLGETFAGGQREPGGGIHATSLREITTAE